MSESTPLMSSQQAPSAGDGSTSSTYYFSAGGGSTSSYYFLQQSDRENSMDLTRSSRDADGGEVIEQLPEGATEEEFASRPVVGSPKRSFGGSNHGNNNKNFFQKLFFGQKRKKGGSSSHASVGTLVKDRKAPLKIEPKVFFSNERTFLAWLHVSILLAGASIAIVAFANSNPWSQIYGVLLLPVAIAFICYSMYQYAKRSAMIRRKDPGPYDDTVGPTILGILLMLSIVAQFAIKLYTMSS